VAAGRRPEDVKIFVALSVVAGATEAEARDRYDEYQRHANPEAGLAHFAASTGVDFARYGLDDPIDYSGSNAIQSAGQTAQQRGWTTRRQLLRQFTLGSRYPTLVGSGSQIADELVRWLDEGDIDGINLSRIVVPETWADFIDHVVPELQRGRYRTAYDEGTLRHKLFGQGDRLPAPTRRRRARPGHPGQRQGRHGTPGELHRRLNGARASLSLAFPQHEQVEPLDLLARPLAQPRADTTTPYAPTADLTRISSFASRGALPRIDPR
jgi:hypothetical protein